MVSQNGLSESLTKKVYMNIDTFVEKMALALEDFMNEVNEDIDGASDEQSEEDWFQAFCEYLNDKQTEDE